jgi:ABC-type lipoprotein export system ATPase subunit
MNINGVTIRGLFHLYNYELLFSGENQVSIITGPNGYGKTTILTMLSELANSHLYYFYTLPFDMIEVSLSDGDSVRVTQKDVKREEEVEGDVRMTLDTEVRFSWIQNGVETSFFLLNEKLIRESYRRGVYRNSGEWRGRFDLRSKEFGKSVASNSHFYELIARSIGQEQFLLKLNSLNFKFIPANRIYKNEDDKEEDATPLKKASEEMKEELKRVQYRYYFTSQKSDSELMDTLLNSQECLCEQEYKEKASAIESFTARLEEFGFLGRNRVQPYDEKNARILSTYIKELERKLQVFQPIMKKLTLFSDLLKAKRFADKKIVFSPDFGIRVRSTNETLIDLDDLSSGEKNEIMLLYKIIFRVPDNSTLLLDEPENSLHVVWQRMLIEDILRIAPEKNLQVIIATHSSRIVTRAKRFTTDLYYLNHQNG